MHSGDTVLQIWKICLCRLTDQASLSVDFHLLKERVAPLKAMRSLNQKKTGVFDLNMNLDQGVRLQIISPLYEPTSLLHWKNEGMVLLQSQYINWPFLFIPRRNPNKNMILSQEVRIKGWLVNTGVCCRRVFESPMTVFLFKDIGSFLVKETQICRVETFGKEKSTNQLPLLSVILV